MKEQLYSLSEHQLTYPSFVTQGVSVNRSGVAEVEIRNGVTSCGKRWKGWCRGDFTHFAYAFMHTLFHLLHILICCKFSMKGYCVFFPPKSYKAYGNLKFEFKVVVCVTLHYINFHRSHTCIHAFNSIQFNSFIQFQTRYKPRRGQPRGSLERHLCIT